MGTQQVARQPTGELPQSVSDADQPIEPTHLLLGDDAIFQQVRLDHSPRIPMDVVDIAGQ